METVRKMLETLSEKYSKKQAEQMHHSQFQRKNSCQVSHTAPGPQQTLEITPATARWGDRQLSWQELCQKQGD